MQASLTVTVQPVFEGSHDHTWKIEFNAQLLDMSTRAGHVENICGSYEETIDAVRLVLAHLINDNINFSITLPGEPGTQIPMGVPMLSPSGVRL